MGQGGPAMIDKGGGDVGYYKGPTALAETILAVHVADGKGRRVDRHFGGSSCDGVHESFIHARL